MWINKYAPTSFDDVVGNAEIVARFRGMCETGYMQHMILCGPPGVGKNTLLHLLMHKVLEEHYEDGTMLFTSFDNKSNQNVRDKIHQFVPKKMAGSKTKFVVFKQAELLSEGVQQVMRRLMEEHYHHAIFVFVCNRIGKLLETIQSRCHIYRFQQVTVHEQKKLLRSIAFKEGNKDQPHIEEVYERITSMSSGDMRFCLNYFQVYNASQQMSTQTHMTDVCLFPYYNNIRALFVLMLDKTRVKNVFGFHTCVKYLNDLSLKGYCGQDIVVFLNDYVVLHDEHIPRNVALEWLKSIALCQQRIANGMDSFVQLCNLVALLYKAA